jgi:hypothetical protein
MSAGENLLRRPEQTAKTSSVALDRFEILMNVFEALYVLCARPGSRTGFQLLIV